MSDVTLFERLRTLRQQGKTPLIELAPGTRVVTPKLPKKGRGRPRKYPPGSDQATRYIGRRGKAIPRCGARGCEKTLRVNQKLACSETCAARIINTAILNLKNCDVTLDDLMKLYGT
jgi:hypothetical protein